MTHQTHKKSKNNNPFANLWNEFLFARDFEYETPLTPDEVAEVLKDIEGKRYKSWFLDSDDMVYSVDYQSQSDKAGSFRVDVESENRGKWWSWQSSLVYSEGDMTVDPDTGMTNIIGRTRFNGSYYGIILFIMLVNLVTQSADQQLFWQIAWAIFIALFWYGMYRSRNQLSDRLDIAIMTDKSEHSQAKLVDNDIDYDLVEHEEENTGYIVS